MKRVINKFLSIFGVQLKRLPVAGPGEEERHILDEGMRKYGWLKKFGINKVIDIGANDGHFANESSVVFSDDLYFCFEPIPSVFEALKARFLSKDKFSFFNVALGEEDDTGTINLNDYSPSSSILEMADLHKEAFDFTSKSHKQEIVIKRLDNFLSSLLPDTATLVKIDVQGYEMQVIKGGKEFLKKSRAVIIEMSFEKLYKDQFLFHDVYLALHDLGYDYHGNIDQLYHPVTHEILQADCFFVNTNL